jgi:hypothetical protein
MAGDGSSDVYLEGQRRYAWEDQTANLRTTASAGSSRATERGVRATRDMMWDDESCFEGFVEDLKSGSGSGSS